MIMNFVSGYHDYGLLKVSCMCFLNLFVIVGCHNVCDIEFQKLSVRG